MSTRDAATPDDDIQAARLPTLVRAGGGIMLAAGALAMLVSVQTLSGFSVRGTFYIVLLGLLAILGLATAACGLMTMRGRVRGAVGGVVASAILFAVTALWLVMSLRGGLVSLFALGAPFVSIGAIVMAALSIGPCRRASDARARLIAGGLDLGI